MVQGGWHDGLSFLERDNATGRLWLRFPERFLRFSNQPGLWVLSRNAIRAYQQGVLLSSTGREAATPTLSSWFKICFRGTEGFANFAPYENR
jgi:hypothetical protein